MLDKRIENYQLQCFAMVAAYENMSKAAKQLHISQPSLSQTIRRLETEWGYPLFERTGNKISLNEDGKILLQAIRKSGRIMLDALRLTEERHEVSHGEIRVYMGCASMYLPELLQYLRRSEQKKMVYKIHQWQQDATRGQEIGIVAVDDSSDLVFLENQSEDELFLYEILFEEEIFLAVPTENPLAAKEVITANDLNTEEFVALNDKWMLGETVELQLKGHAFRPNVTVMLDNPSLLREVLGEGEGIAFVPAISWRSFAGEKVVIRRVEQLEMKRRICLRIPKGRFYTQEQKDCMERIRTFFKEKEQAYMQERATIR